MSFDPEQLPIPDLRLICPHCGYGLAGLTRHQCPECGRPFTMDEMVPPGDFPILIFDQKEVHNSPEIVRLLQAYEIPYMEISHSSEAILGIGALTRGGRRIGVARTCYLEVIDLLWRQKLGEPMPAPPTHPHGRWRCPGCGEENPGNFDICWNCAGPLPDAS